MVCLLIEKSANKDKAKTNRARPALIAVCYGHLHVVRFLREMGADKDRPISDGTTPVFVAGQHGHLEIVRRLIGNGADVDTGTKGWRDTGHRRN